MANLLGEVHEQMQGQYTVDFPGAGLLELLHTLQCKN
jgi:hypothetical protein